MSGNIIIGFPNRVNGAMLSGGSWLAGLPVENVGSRELYKVARSTDATLASTKFSVDLGETRLLRVFALVNHNLSATATWRVTIGSIAGGSDLYDSTWSAAWAMAFDGLVDWESSVWWTGAGEDEYLRSQFPAMIAMPDLMTGRYITVEISDAVNIDGYVQIGRVFMGGGLQPEHNASYGLQNSWRDLSTVDFSESGAMWATERRRLRSVSFSLDLLSPAEAAYFHDMQRRQGVTNEVLYLPFPDNMGCSQRYGFLGILSELSALEFPYPRVCTMPVKIEELG